MENLRNGQSHGGQPQTDSFQLGAWTVNPAANQIFQEGLTVRLEPLAMDVLCLLARSPGDVISKERFIASAWQGRAVSDNAVSRVITELRKALHDDPKQPSYIQTISRKGYRLIVEVGPFAPPPAQVYQSEHVGKARNRNFQKPRRSIMRILFSALALVLLALVLGRGLKPEAKELEGSGLASVFRLKPVTTRKGLETDPNFSRDGRFLLYRHFTAAHANGSVLVWRDMVSMRERVVTDAPENAVCPTWSKDQNRFAYLAHGSETSQVLVRDVMSHNGEVSEGTSLYKLPRLERQTRLAWALEDQRLVFNQRANPQSPFQLHLLMPDTGQITQLTMGRQGGLGDFDFAVFDWGHKVAVLRSRSWNASQIVVHDLKTGDETVLAELPFLARGISWIDEDMLVYGSPAGLVVLSVDTGNQMPVGPKGSHFYRPAVRPGAEQLLVLKLSADRDIWRHSRREDDRLPSKVVVSSNRNDFLPRISHSEKYLAFVSNRSGRQQVWTMDVADRQKLRQISPFSKDWFIKDLKWSPDDGQILIWTYDWNLMVLDVSTGTSNPLPITYAAMPSWSHDSEKVYFTSDREEGWQVWSYTFATQRLERVTKGGGYVFATGKEFNYLLKFYQPGIWSFPGNEKVAPFPDARFWRSWVVREDRLFFPWKGEGFGGIFSFDPEEKRMQPFFPLDDPWHSHFTISKDAVYYDQVASKESDLYLLDLPETLVHLTAKKP